MWLIEVYKDDQWKTIFSDENQIKATEKYEKMLREPVAKTGLSLISPEGNISRLCHG